MTGQVQIEKPPGNQGPFSKGEEKCRGVVQDSTECPDRDRVASELDLKARNVEEQLEQLTDLVRSLTERISAEEDAKELLKIQLDEAYATPRGAGQPRHEGALEPTKCLAECNLNNEVEKKNALRVFSPQALRAAEELQYLLQQERDRNNEMRMQYERQLKQIRSGVERQKRDLKQTLLQQVEFIILKYRQLATEAVQLAKQERKKTQEERVKARELAERACKSFEKDLKERTKKALEDYRSLARDAHKAAKAERDELQASTALESSVKRDLQHFEAQVVREAEKRVQCYRLKQQSTCEELERERRRFAALMSEVSEKVERECRDYEAAVVKSLVVFCKSKGIDVDEESLQKQMATIRQQQIKAHATAQLEKNEGAALTVRYGFQAVAP